MSTLEQPSMASNLKSGSAAVKDRHDPGQVERHISPSKGWVAVDWAEIYQSRDLLNTLVMRDVRVRYKQTVLGVGWAIIQPLASMVIFTLVFSNFPGVNPPDVPYPLFLLAGLIPWNFFNNAVNGAGTSLLAQQHLISKIYFPRIYVPASNVGTNLVDMMVGLALFGLLMPYYHFAPSINLIFLPLILLLTFLAALGFGLIFASVTVLYRDLRFVVPFLMSLLMYASPIFYQTSILSERVQMIVAVNPVTGLVSAYRWCILGQTLDLKALALSVVVTLAVLFFGLFFFRRTERFIADLI